MFLHLTDDEKFTDYVIDIFDDVAPEKNQFLVYTKTDKPIYVKSTQSNVKVIKDTDLNKDTLVKELVKYKVVFLHFLNTYKQELVRLSPKSVKFHWFCWGSDLYNVYPLKMKLILNQKHHRVNPLKKIYTYIRAKQKQKPYINLFKKINSVSTIVPNEFGYVKKYLNNNLINLRFKYITIESLGLTKSDYINGRNIWIGNSATFTNNHIDAFKKIANITHKGDVYVPLSYGSEETKHEILTKGKRILGSRFVAITDFLPLHIYKNKLRICEVVIMNHLRQQALANLVIALWFGAKVFLNKENLIYDYFKSKKIEVYLMKDLDKLDTLPQPNYLAEKNRPKLISLYSRVQVLKETKNLVKALSE